MRPNTRTLPKLIDHIEGYYLARVIDTLYQEGVLQILSERKDYKIYAREQGLDLQLLYCLLEYASIRSDLIERCETKDGVSFVVSPVYNELSLQKHLLDQYVGAYGPCIDKLSKILRAPSQSSSIVNFTRHAASFAPLDNIENDTEVAKLISELQINKLLDIGCGSGTMLVKLGKHKQCFSAIGLDPNREMITIARNYIANSELNARIKVIQGDSSQLNTLLTKDVRESIEAISAVSVANAFFGGRSGPNIENFFLNLRQFFPNRILINADYYGRIGRNFSQTKRFQRTFLHDIAQVVSGQGVPPQNLKEWLKIYKKCSCRFIKAFKGEKDGVKRFIHIVQL